MKRPTAATLRSDYAAASAWAAELFGAVGLFTLETAEVGRTTVGANRLPAAAVFTSAEAEIGFVGKAKEAARFVELAGGLAALHASFRVWALKRPLKLLELGADALTAARVALWLQDNPEPGIYVRQLSLTGVHTKFIENHRAVISELAVGMRGDAEHPEIGSVDESLPGSPAEPGALLGLTPARTPAARFAAGHGFLHPPELVRFRLLDPAVPLLGQARDLTLTAEAFSTLSLPVTKVLITENLVNFLALPERPGTLAIYGGGYGFSSLRDGGPAGAGADPLGLGNAVVEPAETRWLSRPKPSLRSKCQNPHWILTDKVSMAKSGYNYRLQNISMRTWRRSGWDQARDTGSRGQTKSMPS